MTSAVGGFALMVMLTNVESVYTSERASSELLSSLVGLLIGIHAQSSGTSARSSVGALEMCSQVLDVAHITQAQ